MTRQAVARAGQAGADAGTGIKTKLETKDLENGVEFKAENQLLDRRPVGRAGACNMRRNYIQDATGRRGDGDEERRGNLIWEPESQDVAGYRGPGFGSELGLGCVLLQDGQGKGPNAGAGARVRTRKRETNASRRGGSWA